MLYGMNFDVKIIVYEINFDVTVFIVMTVKRVVVLYTNYTDAYY